MSNTKFNTSNTMKSSILFIISIFIFNSISAQLKMSTSGDFGIGTDPVSNYYKLKINGPVKISENSATAFATLEVTSSPSSTFACHISGSLPFSNYMLYVAGPAFSTGTWQSSDINFKKNITKLDGSLMLAKLMNVDGKKYEFKDENELQQVYSQLNKDKNNKIQTPDFPEGYQYGLIAQDLEKEFPELVKTDNVSQTKAVNYNGMIPILLEAIKTLNTEIEDLKSQVSSASVKSGFLISNSATESPTSKSNNEITNLGQNTPNPFTQQTVINMYIPKEVNSAVISISDMQGIQLQTKAITERGNVNLVLEASGLLPGIYVYSLTIDGNKTETKRMILTN